MIDLLVRISGCLQLRYFKFYHCKTVGGVFCCCFFLDIFIQCKNQAFTEEEIMCIFDDNIAYFYITTYVVGAH